MPFIPVAFFLLMQAKTLCFIVLAGINKPVNCSSFGLGFFFFFNAIEFRAMFQSWPKHLAGYILSIQWQLFNPLV